MDNDLYFAVHEIERSGKLEEGFKLLEELANKGHPLALVELAERYYSIEGYANPVYDIAPDHQKHEMLLKHAFERLLQYSIGGDGEAMRMLAYTYLGLYGPLLEKNIDKAESWLLKAIDAGCHTAANDLISFYQFSDRDKAKYWVDYADKHNCRVVSFDDTE